MIFYRVYTAKPSESKQTEKQDALKSATNTCCLFHKNPVIALRESQQNKPPASQ